MRPLFQTRFPRFYRKRSGDRDVSARATHLKAAMENVFMTTTERKRMSTKTTFKRIALVAVAALGLGVLSVAPAANAGGNADTLTLSASSASVQVGDTATITATVEFTSNLGSTNGFMGPDSTTIYIAGTGAGGSIITTPTSDTTNAVTFKVGKPLLTGVATGWNGTTGAISTGLGGTGADSTTSTTAGTALTVKTDSIVAVTAGAYTKAAFSIKFASVGAAGTYIYTITTRDKASMNVYKTATFTLTVTAGDTTGTAAKSLLWLNDTQTVGAPSVRADSSVVKSAGAAATPKISGFLVPEFRNAADTITTSTLTSAGSLVNESMTVIVTGPGLLTTQVGRADATAVTTLAKSVTVSQGDTVVVWSDGTPGTATFTGYIGGVALTQAAKTLKFFGKPATITATLESASVTNSGVAAGVISFVVKDSAANALTSTNIQYNTGTPSGFFLILPDTKVVSGTATVAGATPSYVACSTYNATASRWECSPTILESGTVSVVIADSYTAASSVATVSAALTITAAGSGYKGTITSDKTTYVVGEKAMITLTQKDYNGLNVIDKTSTSPQFGSPYWASSAPTFGDDASAQAVGGHLGSSAFISYLSAASYYGGIDTVSVYMPTTAGTYTLMSIVPGATTASAIWTFSVTDPTRDAADAATDAALEATDAAYAAQDAAQLAAEAADAATAAAEAATAAVEDLATQVASLFADLQKQITTLANVVAKIAKKVKA